MSNKVLAGLTFSLALTFLALATSGAFAFEVTDQLRLDNTVTSIYSTENDTFDSDYEAELIYSFSSNLTANALAEFDLNYVEMTEIRFGVEYIPTQVNGLTLSAYSVFDDRFDYTDTELELELKF